jgi:hypothetical protein
MVNTRTEIAIITSITLFTHQISKLLINPFLIV